MSLCLNQNVTALSAYSNLNRSSSRMDASIGRLSSGLRINHAADDAAGMTISEKMRSQIRCLSRAKLNCQDGMSMLQTAEGGLNESESIIQRMRELAIQASNDTLTSNDRLEIQKEINQLRDAIDDIADSTEYNTKKLLDGSQTAVISTSSNSATGVATGSIAESGDFSVSMALVKAGVSQVQTSQLFMNKNTGELATGSTVLEDIAQFYDANGVFAIATPQILTATGNSESYSFTVDGKMTLNQLAAAMQNALCSSTEGLGLANSQVSVITSASTGITGMGGYLKITSGRIGEVGEFSFAGDQAMVDALGLANFRESEDNVVEVHVDDGTEEGRTTTTSNDRASGLLNGIDIKFDSNPAQITGSTGIVQGVKFDHSSTLTFNFSLDGSRSMTAVVTVSVQFGPNSKFSMEGIAAHINNAIHAACTAGVTVGTVTTPVSPLCGMEACIIDGELRLSYSPVNPKAPAEITVRSTNSVLGITDGIYSGFVQGSKDLSSCVTGFSLHVDDAAKSGAQVDFKITDGKGASALISLGTTVTAGPDLVVAEDWAAISTTTLSGANVDARIDIVNNTFAVTSTHLGNYNREGYATIESSLSIESVVSTTTTVKASDIFGYTDGTAFGTGDTNFRMHIVDTCPTFQIGANEGQNMTVNICDMSAAALGIDKLDMTTTEGAQIAIGKIDNALAKVSAERSKLGAYVNRMEYTSNELENARVNMTDSESRIRDCDMASEMSEFSSAQVMNQAATAMLAQANAASQNVLQLLQ